MPATTPTVWRCAAILLMALALTACAGTPQQQAHQKIEWLIVAAAAAGAALSSDSSSSSSSGGTVSATAPNIARAPTYTPDSTHSAYRRGNTDTFYMAGCTGSCYRNVASGDLANVLESPGSVYPGGVPFLHRRIQSQPLVASVRVPEPPRDVRQAWRDGWTGQGVNMLIVDAFGARGSTIELNDMNDRHGYAVYMSALEVAPRATHYALESGTDTLRYGVGGVRGANGVRVDYDSPRFHVVNLSFGNINPSSTGGAPTQAEINAATAQPYFRDLLGHRPDTDDAVITKAAGNDGIDAGRRAGNAALATHRSTSPRVLIVGALDGYARTSNPQMQPNVRTDANIADYSDFAGSNEHIQRRFLVEYGGTPYGEFSGLCDYPEPPCRNPQTIARDDPLEVQGTSFAAPRVAGFAALVRHKFPSLNGAHTANILLETATTQGLACHTGTARKSSACARNVYGQGRVDIGAALAPIGSLR